MVSAWERALGRNEGPAAAVKRRYQDLTPAGRAELRRSVERKNLAPPPQPEPSTQQSAPQRPRWALPTGTPLITPSGVTPTAEDYAVAGQFAEDMLLGPERESAITSGQASPLERFVRDWGLSEQEFRTAGERFEEGRPGAGVGWGILGLAGAIPFIGDVAQGVAGAGRAAGAAGDVARGAERATDVVRAAESQVVVGRNMADEFLSEMNNNWGRPVYQKPNIQTVPQERMNVAELAYRQGYEAPPRIVDSQAFDSLIGPADVPARQRLPYEAPLRSENIVVYRGVRDGPDINDDFGRLRTGESYANELINGEYFVGHGVRGHGTYFTLDPTEAIGYSAAISTPMGDLNGAMVRAIISPNAKLLDGSNFEAMKAFRDSPFADVSEFAIANGYDGIRYNFFPDAPNRDHVVILNRSVVTFDATPRLVSIEDAHRIYMEDNARTDVLNRLFGDGRW